MPQVRLSDYHFEVNAAVDALDASLAAGDAIDSALQILEARLRGPASQRVVDARPHGRSELLAAVRVQLEQPLLHVPSNPQGRVALVRILLLHRIDDLWWQQLTPYRDRAAVECAPELLSLPALKKAGALRFGFATQPERWLQRAGSYARRRLAPGRRPRVSGMRFLFARAEIVAVLNEIADLLRAAAPAGTPPLWVNSIVRSTEHQQHLKDLGYAAFMPSSHCVGYSADVEMTWFESFGAAGALKSILLDYRQRDVLNIIEEGQAWHLCLNPDHVSNYRTH